MDFMKWLNSLDELLYEAMSWLLFFPITLWRATVHPIRMMADVERQDALPEDEQYAAVLTPPLFLALALLLAHAAATALGQTDAIIANRHGLAALVTDNATALFLRVLVFAGFPLFLAARFVRGTGQALDRRSLRRPFYAQCYPAAVFAFGISVGTSLTQVDHDATRLGGQVIVLASILYFIIVETGWFAATRKIGRARALANVAAGMAQGAAFMLFVGFLFTR